MRVKSAVVGLAAAVFASACSGTPEGIAAPDASLDQVQNGPVTADFVTASAHYWDAARGAWITDVIHAQVMPDGTVEGRFEIRVHFKSGGGARLNGQVTCMVIEGNRAWLGGVIHKAADPTNNGMPYGFKAIDNGEGAGAPPDQFGRRRFPPSAEQYCAEKPDNQAQPVFDVEAGNVLIHGR